MQQNRMNIAQARGYWVFFTSLKIRCRWFRLPPPALNKYVTVLSDTVKAPRTVKGARDNLILSTGSGGMAYYPTFEDELDPLWRVTQWAEWRGKVDSSAVQGSLRHFSPLSFFCSSENRSSCSLDAGVTSAIPLFSRAKGTGLASWNTIGE